MNQGQLKTTINRSAGLMMVHIVCLADANAFTVEDCGSDIPADVEADFDWDGVDSCVVEIDSVSYTICETYGSGLHVACDVDPDVDASEPGADVYVTAGEGSAVTFIFGTEATGQDFCCAIYDETPNANATIDFDIYGSELGDYFDHDGYTSLTNSSVSLDQADDFRGNTSHLFLTVFAGDGDDDFVGSDADHPWDGPGMLEGVQGGGGIDTLDGGAGDDWLFGGAGNDVIEGREGEDWVIGGVGDDDVHGGQGDDLVCAGEWGGLIRTCSTTGDSGTTNTLWGGQDDDEIIGAEGADHICGGVYSVTGCAETGDGADVISGNGGADVIDGSLGDDIISGGGGADSIQGGRGNDELNGDGGDDYLCDTRNGSANDVNHFDGGSGTNDFWYQQNDSEVVKSNVPPASATAEEGHCTPIDLSGPDDDWAGEECDYDLDTLAESSLVDCPPIP
jgi:Ca2+-binding RTX toxin-like protein